MGLRNHSSLVIIFFIAVFLQACSVSRWTVINEEAKDSNDYEIVDTQYILESTNGLTPDQPIIHFDLKGVHTYEYAQRVHSERYVQHYRPRLGYVLLGAAGAGLSYYAAFSDQLLSRPTAPQRYALTGAGTLLTGLSLLNMKPVGEPKKTGEQRLLRKSGIITELDTTATEPYTNDNAFLKITYKEEVLLESDAWNFDGNRLSINLAEEINASNFEENPSEKIVIQATYDTLSHTKRIGVADIFEQFVVVDVQLTPLRNEPEVDPDNVLNDLAEGSQLKLVSREGEWYKVLYGISETWVAANDVRSIWRPSEFASDLSVIAVPNVPFGSVDVEQQIPVLSPASDDASAFILSNFDYEGDISTRIYGQRDAKLMEEYFSQALGVRKGRIVKATNVTSNRLLERAYSRLASSVDNPSQTLMVYINGYAEIRDSRVYLLGTEHSEDNDQLVNLNQFFRALRNLNVGKMFVFADLDFVEHSTNNAALQNLAELITEQDSSSAVVFSSSENQQSGIFSSTGGEQKRHSIFTYYLADALKNRNTTLTAIMSHLERNVSFTSRSLYDRPQTPLFYGRRELELLN